MNEKTRQAADKLFGNCYRTGEEKRARARVKPRAVCYSCGTSTGTDLYFCRRCFFECPANVRVGLFARHANGAAQPIAEKVAQIVKTLEKRRAQKTRVIISP